MKSISILLLATFLFSAGIPVFAQKDRTGRVPFSKDVQFERIDALTEGQGVLVRWEMKTGEPTLGFHIFRIGALGLEQVNESLIIGSVVKRRSAGIADDYEFFDENGVMGSTYLIEALTLNERRVSSQPFGTKYTADLAAETGLTREFIERRTGPKNSLVENDRLSLTRELDKAVSASQLEANLTEHFRVVGLPGAKIAVTKEGLHRVTRAQLQAVGFNVAANSANWRLFNEGNEQAIIIGPSGDYVEFYGKGIDRPESDTRMYYLIADTVAGKRVDTRVLRPVGGTAVSSSFRFAATKKERLIYFDSIKNGDEENFFGRGITSVPGTLPDFAFNLAGTDPAASNAVITVKIQGILFGQHSVSVMLNGRDIGNVVGEHLDSISTDLTVPADFLIEGANTLKFSTANSADYLLFDSVTVKYSRRYAADQNRIAFFTPGYRRAEVGGFTSPNIRVFDTTEDGSPRLVVNLQVEQNGSTHTVKIPSSRAAVLYGIEDSASLTPASVTANVPSSLNSSTNRADMIIISAPDLILGSESWANYRRSAAGGGFTVNVVDLTDVIDEFNYGVFSSDAIRNFLQYSRNNWQTPKPQYVLLMGDASYDPRNYEGNSSFSQVPTKLVELIFEQTGSDDAMGDFNGDALAEVAIGRIPARSPGVITTVLNKTVAFETTATQAINRGALFAFDRPITYDFEAMSSILRNELPVSVPSMNIFRGTLSGSFDQGHDPLIAAINTGKFLVNYSGHGAGGVWASTTFFSNADVSLLTNANSQSIFTMLTCFNGLFIRPNADSLSEVLLKSTNGGAVATWASSASTTPDYQLTMGTRFYNRIGAANPSFTRIGDFVRDAKTTIGGSDVAYSWTLLGDPALRVR